MSKKTVATQENVTSSVITPEEVTPVAETVVVQGNGLPDDVTAATPLSPDETLLFNMTPDERELVRPVIAVLDELGVKEVSLETVARKALSKPSIFRLLDKPHLDGAIGATLATEAFTAELATVLSTAGGILNAVKHTVGISDDVVLTLNVSVVLNEKIDTTHSVNVGLKSAPIVVVASNSKKGRAVSITFASTHPDANYSGKTVKYPNKVQAVKLIDASRKDAKPGSFNAQSILSQDTWRIAHHVQSVQ